MATLTEPQQHDLRKDIADAKPTPKLSPDELNRAYTLAGGTSDDLDATRVICLRWLLAMAIPDTDEFDQYERLLKVWEKAAGMEGGPLRTGLINLGIDTPEESEWAS